MPEDRIELASGDTVVTTNATLEMELEARSLEENRTLTYPGPFITKQLVNVVDLANKSFLEACTHDEMSFPQRNEDAR